VLRPRVRAIRERQFVFGRLERSIYNVGGLATRSDCLTALDPSNGAPDEDLRIRDRGAVRQARGLLVAVLTLARAWFAAGQPRASTPPVGSFERWTEVVAGILQYAGVDAFLANSEALFELGDIERSDWETFLEAMEDAFQGSPFTVAELWERLNEKTYTVASGPPLTAPR
jgi:hypothetical protein